MTNTGQNLPSLARNDQEARALAHWDRVLGHGRPPAGYASGGPVTALRYPDPTVGVTHFATLGFSTLDVTVPNPTELVCSVRPGQENAGYALLVKAIQMAESTSATVTFGTMAKYDVPVLPDSSIRGLMFGANVWSDELDLVYDANEDIELAAITVMPMVQADVALVEEKGLDVFDSTVYSTKADVFDLYRTEPL